VGREDRGRLPLCSRDPRVHARPGGGQLNEAQRGPIRAHGWTEPIACAGVLSPEPVAANKRSIPLRALRVGSVQIKESEARARDLSFSRSQRCRRRRRVLRGGVRRHGGTRARDCARRTAGGATRDRRAAPRRGDGGARPRHAESRNCWCHNGSYLARPRPERACSSKNSQAASSASSPPRSSASRSPILRLCGSWPSTTPADTSACHAGGRPRARLPHALTFIEANGYGPKPPTPNSRPGSSA
jgi:hypothetical protein